MWRFAIHLRLVLILALAGLLGFSGALLARENFRSDTLASVRLTELPPEAKQTLELIQRGGPFPFPKKDGSTFGNRENRLPQQTRGYYREYTVAANDFTPARGAKRIVCGGWAPRQPDDCYYSADHYASFMRIQAQP